MITAENQESDFIINIELHPTSIFSQPWKDRSAEHKEYPVLFSIRREGVLMNPTHLEHFVTKLTLPTHQAILLEEIDGPTLALKAKKTREVRKLFRLLPYIQYLISTQEHPSSLFALIDQVIYLHFPGG